MIKKFFDHQAKSLNLAAIILALTSFLSALLGLLRDRLLAGRFGAGDELDIYYAAFRIPDFLTMVLVLGAISAAIIPVFSQYLVRSQKEAWRFLSNLLNIFIFFLILISLILIIFVPQIIQLIVPGFSPEKKELTAHLTRIMFLSPFLLGIGNILSSILCVFRRFLVASLTPIVYNLGIIFGILFFVPLLGLPGLAWGVVLGGIFYILIQLPTLLRIGFSFQKIFDLRDEGLKKVIQLTLPRSLGLAAQQVNLIFITLLTSTISTGGIAILNLAENLSRPLLTFIGISYSTAAFPNLALAFSKKDKEKFFEIFSTTFSKIILLMAPLCFLLFIFRELVVNLILKVGKFGVSETSLTAACLGMFALGLVFQALTLLVVKAFYALGNTKTPALISILTMIFNLILALLFIYFLSFPNFFQEIFGHLFSFQDFKRLQLISLPLTISLSSIFQFILLFLLFKRKMKIALSNEKYS